MFDAHVYFCHTHAMQVWTKLTLGFAATALVIVGLYGGYQLREEEADLRHSAERHLRLIATTVQVAAGNAFRDKQAADVREIVDAIKLREPSVDVVVFDAEAIADRSTYEDGRRLAVGMEHVIVNGELVLHNGERTQATPGRALRP